RTGYHHSLAVYPAFQFPRTFLKSRGQHRHTEGDKEKPYRLGDLVKHSLKEIIESEHYGNVISKVYSCINVHKECYTNCRTHSINDFLWEHKDVPENEFHGKRDNSLEHINFV
ncbi:MAG: hypothetical protein QF687_07815, partial [Nitrospinaceae bacterium]|nr:hypothetical protein [Nitrospinaceae bacterium]